jgi:putative transposase
MSAGNKQSRAGRARDVALFRYTLVRSLADPQLSSAERGALVRELAGRVHTGPFGEPVRVSRASLDRWIRAWRAGGFDALLPTARQVAPRTDAGVLELAERLKRERPARTAAHIVAIIDQERGWAPSARTVQRLFARLGLNVRRTGPRRRRLAGSKPTCPMSCGSPTGCTGRWSKGARRCCSPCSMTIPGMRWGTGGATGSTPLGCRPRCMMRSRPTAARNGCTPTTARPTSPPSWPGRWRCWTSGWCIRNPAARKAGARSNGGTAPCATSSWSKSRPATRPAAARPAAAARSARWPSSTGCSAPGCTTTTTAACTLQTGATPAARYHAQGRAPAPRPDPARLRRAFLWREQRKVTAFATVSLHGNRYEVDSALVGRTIDLLFIPFDLTVIEVEYQGRPMGQASPHTITRHVHPDIKPQAPEAVQATGIDYLRLLDDARHQAGQAINFPALADHHPDEADQPSLFTNPEHPEPDGSQQA